MDKKKVTRANTIRSEARLAYLVGMLRSRPYVSSQVGTAMVSHNSRIGDSLMESVGIDGLHPSNSAFQDELHHVKKPSSDMSKMFSASRGSILSQRHRL
jgi:hypothetical protein